MKYLSLLVVASSLLLFSCKKDKKDDTDPSTDDSASGYYIKGKVNGTSVETADGVGGYTIVDGSAYGGLSFSYFCSFQKVFSNGKYFQLSLSAVDTEDEDDSDELPNFIIVEDDTLNDGEAPYYSFSYTDENDRYYKVDPDQPGIEILIDEVTDLGKKNVNGDSKRAVVVKGRIPSGRLYEYSWDEFDYTGEYIDLTDVEFVVRFSSHADMP